MSLPAPYTVYREPYVPGGVDAHGDPVGTWGDPIAVAVHGWAPPSPDAEPITGRSAVERDLDLYAPAGTAGAPKDRWVVGGVEYSQVGWPEDFTNGPWQWAAGVRINLLRIEG